MIWAYNPLEPSQMDLQESSFFNDYATALVFVKSVNP